MIFQHNCYSISEKTRRSQFLSYFSFPLINTTEGLGFPAKGGLRLQNTGKIFTKETIRCFLLKKKNKLIAYREIVTPYK